MSKCTYKNINYVPSNNKNKDENEHNTNNNWTIINQHDNSHIKRNDMIRNNKSNDFNIINKGKAQITEIPDIYENLQRD